MIFWRLSEDTINPRSLETYLNSELLHRNGQDFLNIWYAEKSFIVLYCRLSPSDRREILKIVIKLKIRLNYTLSTQKVN